MSSATAVPGRVALAELVDSALSAEDVRLAVTDPGAGGVVVFTGAVRSHAGGRAVTGLDYEAHPGAPAQLAAIAAAVAARDGVVAVAVVHRVGSLGVGEPAVVAAASAAHRREAFLASQELIDRVKAEVAIWKRERYADGASEWVGTP